VVNGRAVCTLPCCVGTHEVRFDNGRFSSVECISPGDEYTDDDDTDDDDNDDDDDDDSDD